MLIDHLATLALERVAVLDIAAEGMAVARERLGSAADRVTWITADVTRIDDVGMFDVWHDRAVFHFLVDPEDRRRYVRLAERSITPGGTAIVATFAPDGPERCSGLPVQRWDPSSLARELGPAFRLVDSLAHVHTTPGGTQQRFQYSVLRYGSGMGPTWQMRP